MASISFVITTKGLIRLWKGINSNFDGPNLRINTRLISQIISAILGTWSVEVLFCIYDQEKAGGQAWKFDESLLHDLMRGI